MAAASEGGRKAAARARAAPRAASGNSTNRRSRVVATARRRGRFHSQAVDRASAETPAPATGWKNASAAETRLELLDHLFDQEIAERYAAQAVLTVGDRIENRGV